MVRGGGREGQRQGHAQSRRQPERAGDKADYVLAAKWYGAAAAYGLADSQYNLGILAEHGLGTPKNLDAAYQWFALAAKNGDAEAAKRRDLVKGAARPEDACRGRTDGEGLAAEACRAGGQRGRPAFGLGRAGRERPTPPSSPARRSCSTSSATMPARPTASSAGRRAMRSRASSAATASRRPARSPSHWSPSSSA